MKPIHLLLAAAPVLHALEFERHSFPTEQDVWGVGAADVNGDGVTDILAGTDSQAVAFLMPEGERVVLHDFVEPRLLHALSLDCDGDGDLDFLVSRRESFWNDRRARQAAGEDPGPEPEGPDFTIAWIENTGRVEGAQPLHVVEIEMSHVHGLAAGDVNADGVPDLVASSYDGPLKDSVALYQARKGGSGFEPRVWVSRGGAPGRAHYLDVADMDADGAADILLGAPANGRFAFWRQEGREWKLQVVTDLEKGATNPLAGDFNGDGRIDLLTTNGHSQGVHWFAGPAWEKHEIDAGMALPHAVDIGDLDGDGDLDAAVATLEEKIVVWHENDGGGRFTRHLIDEGNGQESYDLRILDLDGDGRLDILVGGRARKNVAWFRQVP